MRFPRVAGVAQFVRLGLVGLGLIAGFACATPLEPKKGVEYQVLEPAQPVQPAGKKVEVIEFFMFHCPHCNALEPELMAWVRKQGDNVNFRRIHFPASPLDPEARLFVTLEAMGRLDLVDKVFHALHVERQRFIRDEAAIFDWVAKNGVDRAKFIDYWNSFGVQTKLRRSVQLVNDYKVEGAPTLVVDGRYMTSPSMVKAGSPDMTEPQLGVGTTQVLDALVAKVKKDSGAKR